MVQLINKLDNLDIANESFILDTNIWLYIHSYFNTNNYGYPEILDLLLENEAKILLPPLVCTEFVNRFCRQAFESFKNDEKNKRLNYKKDFRSTNKYLLAFNYITTLIQEDIFPHTTFINITSEDLNSAINSPCLKDLNDDIILNMAIRTNSIIITHDRDYLDSNKNIRIIQN